MDLKYYLKIFLGLIGTIFLGAMGSGLWERVFSPLFDKLMELSINSINFFFFTYKDSIYNEVSNGFHEYYSLQLWTLLLLLIPMLYVRILAIHPVQKQEKKNLSFITLFLVSKKGYWFIVGITFLVLAIMSFSMLRHKYINSTITYATTSMEILKPYITEQEYILLRSQFFSISNSKQFENFYIKINDLAKKNTLELHDFNPL